MRTKTKSVTVYIAVDGMEFKTARECKEYEMRTNTLGARTRRVKELLKLLNDMKHSNGFYTLKNCHARLVESKAKLLEAAKGKRRYTVKFATDIKKAANEYLTWHEEYQRLRIQFDELRAELKDIEPKFDRSKKGL